MIGLFDQKPAQNCYKEAKEHKIVSYHRLSGVSEMAITSGMRELEALQIVDVLRGWPAGKGRPYNDKPVNCYLLKSLPSLESIQQAWEVLEAGYGKEQVALGRKLAAFIDQQNNFQAVEKFIQLVDTYTYDWTESAVRITAKLAVQNPGRNVFYVEGILTSGIFCIRRLSRLYGPGFGREFRVFG